MLLDGTKYSDDISGTERRARQESLATSGEGDKIATTYSVWDDSMEFPTAVQTKRLDFRQHTWVRRAFSRCCTYARCHVGKRQFPWWQYPPHL